MKLARIQVIIGFFLTVSIIVTYKVITAGLVDPGLKKAQIAYQTEKIELERVQLRRYDALEEERFQVKRATLRRDNDLGFYGIIGFFSAGGLALIILALGYSRARIRRSSIHTARIGQHSEIPIHQKDLQSFYPIAVNLSLAEIEASTSTAHQNAYHISRQMIEDITEYTRAIAGKRGMLALGSGPHDLNYIDISAHTATPTFADLLNSNTIAPGKPLILGYDRQGQPQYRTLQDLKSLAVAGWQGSGKTFSMGYIVASSVLAYGVQAYIVDPHKHHPESLYSLIKPLEDTGQVTVINPFDTADLIVELNAILDRRLAGKEPGEPGILLVIDEMARLAKMECFDVLISFLERCTEETRKANITFIGGSNKWTARHFKGRADIRSCMNSVLIHKMKPSQADLLLEDAHDKNLVKQLQRPGDAILVTDFAMPTLITMPLCKREDMAAVADFINNPSQRNQTEDVILSGETETVPVVNDPETPVSHNNIQSIRPKRTSETGSTKKPSPEKRKTFSDVIPFELHFNRKYNTTHQRPSSAADVTVKMIREQLQQLRKRDPHLTQAEIAKKAGLSPGHLSRILREKSPLNESNKHKLYTALFNKGVVEAPAARH